MRPVTCAILQPSYIPWRGYFHQVQKSDVIVLYDDVQYDKHGWRNRNRIKTANGPLWLTIPARHKGNVTQKRLINEIRIVWDKPWNARHFTTLQQAYGKAPCFSRYAGMLEAFYARRDELLCDFTAALTIALSRELGLETRFERSSELGVSGDRLARILGILRKVGATHYVSGPSARTYLEEKALSRAGLTFEYMTYDYPQYPQLHPPYDPQVSVLDLLFMTGPKAGDYIWGKRAAAAALRRP